MIYVMLAGMEKKIPPPEPQNRFAEVIKKSKEKRAEMNSNAAERAEAAAAEEAATETTGREEPPQ